MDANTPKDAPFVAWLQRINGQYATILRWVAVGGCIYGGIEGRPDIVASFTGLLLLPNVVGRPS